MEAPRLEGERVLLRAMTSNDTSRVAEIRAEPEVTRWWPSRSTEYLTEKLDRDGLACWVVELDGRAIGFAQAYEDASPDYRHAGIDLFLAGAFQGRGLGRDVVRTVARYLVGERAHHRIVIDPAAANARAIRCYEAVGFRRVGILRSYWWDHVEERWVDGVLLDLLAGELE